MRNTGLLFAVFWALLDETWSTCTYLSTSTILSLDDPSLTVDVKLDSTVINAKQNIGYGVWMKYQPFAPISEISITHIQLGNTVTITFSSGPSDSSTSSASNQFIYLLQQKDSKFNVLIVYASLDSSAKTITHDIYYSFQTKTGTISIPFDYTTYEGKWVLFYMFCNQLSATTIFGFYQADKTTPLSTISISDLPSFTKTIRHSLGGTQEFKNHLGNTISLSQYKGRLSNVFSEGNTNIFSDINTFLSTCTTASTCTAQTLAMSASNFEMLGINYYNFTTKNTVDTPSYVVKGWVKLYLLGQSALTTTIFRITINSGYSDDMNVGDKELYLTYYQNVIPASNGFTITTYTYSFPVSERYTSSSTDIIGESGAQYLSLLVKWHYIQYEIGTQNNNGQPLFSLYFPSVGTVQQYTWSENVYHFTGSYFYITVGGDKYNSEVMGGYLSDLTLVTYCTTPTMSFNPNCHYSCQTCDGPNLNNCLTCPDNSFRIQSTTQKTCTCKNKYIDINDQPICQAVASIFPSMTEQELALTCSKVGYAVCETNNLQCQFGYFPYKNQCIQWQQNLYFSPTLDDINLSQIPCADCILFPSSFAESLQCMLDLFTYDYDTEESYHQIKRVSNNTNYYIILQGEDGAYYLDLQQGFLSSGKCRQGYYLSNLVCKPCSSGCMSCKSYNYCNQCYDGYSSTFDYGCQMCENCPSCSLVETVVQCKSCADGMYLQNGVCYNCGINCASCSSSGYCYYCDDPQAYFITFDGVNCQTCNIENCLYCYQYYVYNGVTYTTLDIGFTTVGLSSVDLQVGCALCAANLYFNQLTLVCQDKPVTSSPSGSVSVGEISVIGGGGGSGGGAGGGGSQEQCTFGLVTDASGTAVCLISTTSTESTQSANCGTITNCQQCISSYSSTVTFCMICADGYYSAILTGQCLQCDTSCKTCLQQNTIYRDFWKWNIKAYYKYVFSPDDEHPFETYATSTSETDFDVVCTSCPLGYILYQQNCIAACDDSCYDCQIVNGVATCIQCQTTLLGYLKSQTSKGVCLTCPNYCAACTERTDDEIKAINPYFLTTTSNIKYTHLCYERFNVDLTSGYYFYDTLVQTYTVCDHHTQCYNKIILSYNLYCNLTDFQTANNKYTSGNFSLKNDYISYLFKNQYLEPVETSGLFTYLNDKVIREVEFQYTLIQGSASNCTIDSSSSIATKIQQNVFSVQSVNIQIIGSSYPTKVLLADQFTFYNFSYITFKNIQFDTASQGQSTTDLNIILNNLKSPTLSLIKCDFTTSDTSQMSLTYSSNKPYSLIINTLNIKNFKIYNSKIFSFVTSGLPQTVQINNLIISNSYFQNSQLFIFQAISNFLDYQTTINQVIIEDTTFQQSSFITTESELTYDIGSITITGIVCNNTILTTYSNLLKIPSASYLFISDQQLLNSQILVGSSYFKGNIIQFNNTIINNIQLNNSYLITNDVTISESANALFNAANVKIYNCTISMVSYDLQQSILKLLKQQYISYFNVDIQLFYLNTSIYTGTSISEYISYDESIIYIECYQCTLNDVKIQRGYGLPEISILESTLLIISNFTIVQATQYYSKTLHESFDCIAQFAYTEMYFALYIGKFQNITIDSFNIVSCITYNNPLIIMKGYDLMEKIQSENITITNSIFQTNMLIITKQNRESALISIESEQDCTIQFNNLAFLNNHLNEYIQDLTRSSASTMLIQLQQGIVYLKNSYFKQNLVTNSTNSILYIKSHLINMFNNRFYQNNIVNFTLLSPNILLSLDQYSISTLTLESIFTIKSKGGNGILIVTQLTLNKIIVNSSYALYGGGFYINAQGTGNVQIMKSKFSNTKTSVIGSSFSSGGCLYIDAQLAKFTLTLSDSSIDTSYSRLEGGGILILPSQTSNYIELKRLTITNCFSLSSSFFSYQLSKLTSIISTILMQDIEFYATRNGFYDFISNIDDLSDSITTIQSDNPMIKIQYGNITIQNCSFLSTHIMFLLQIDDATNILMEDITIQNSSILYSPLMRLNLRQSYQGTLLINNLKISNVSQYTDYVTSGCTFLTSATLILELTCPAVVPTDTLILENYEKSDIQASQLSCNKYYIYTDKTYDFSLIEIDDFNQTHYLKVKGISLHNNYCPQCMHGLIRILNIQQVDFQNILFNQLDLHDNVCGQTGCLSLLQYYNSSCIRNDILPSRLLQQNNYDVLAKKIAQQALFRYGLFHNNTATYGGGLMIVEIQTTIRKCSFFNNSAALGGAVYYLSNKTRLYLFESEFSANSAQVAGGLFLNNQTLQKTQPLDVVLQNNKSTLFGTDVFEKPRSLTISVDGGTTLLEKKTIAYTSDSIVDQIIIIPYKILGYPTKAKFLTLPSGRVISTYEYFDSYQSHYIPYNLTFRIIALNKHLTQEKRLSGSKCTLSHSFINSTNNTVLSNLTGSLSYSTVSFNSTSGDFNLDDLSIYFNPTYSDEIVMRLKISCDMISIPIYESEPPYLIKNYITDYSLLVDIRTFPCQLGEYLNSTSGGCILCDTSQNQYQVDWSASGCSYKDDVRMKAIQSSMIQLRSTYWRAYYYSQTIESCYHLSENCQGGWYPGDDSCITGHIGALCEQCDLYNKRGNGSYSVSDQYSCGSCTQVVGNVLTIFFISVWTLISILMSVSSTTEMIEEFIVGLRLKAFGVTVVIKQASTAILIKVFTNYLQIISTISTFQLTVPSSLASVVNSVGNPIQSMAYSLDCFLISITDILIIYFRIIWSILLAASYISVFFSLYSMAILTKSVKFNMSFITTALIYVYIYLQPNIVGGLISLISYRIISDEYWIQGNVAYRYDTYAHAKWLIGFCFPLLLTIGGIIPIVLWYGVYKNRAKLDQTKTRQIWGYLYNEYKLHAYYWETIKIVQKELIIIVLSYYEDHIPIKASLVFLFLFGYSFLTTQQKPYMTGDLNYLDSQSTVFCAVSIILGSSIYTAQQSDLQEIVWPFYIMIGILNAIFIFKMLLKILFAYFVKLHDQIDKAKELIIKYFPNFIQRHPFIQELFESRKKQQARVKERFAKVKEYLFSQAKQILEFKRLNNLDLPHRIQTELSISSQKLVEMHKSSLQNINSPISSADSQEKERIHKLGNGFPSSNDNIEGLVLKKPHSSKVYPEIESHRSSLHQQNI